MKRFLALAIVSSTAAAVCTGVAAQALNFTQVPLFLLSGVKPNVLVVYDNSQSMDATMAGQLIAGDDPTTRGNVARSVLRNTISSYRTSFNWGLATFETSGNPQQYLTYAYYFGSDADMVYTNDCVNGVSASTRGLRCIPNPERGNGYNYITYSSTGDDPTINDILYQGSDWGPQAYGIGISGSTSYYGYKNHKATTGWSTNNDFSNYLGGLSFTPTDAGYLPSTPPYGRMLWIKRAWGYNNNITGKGVIKQPVAPDSAVQFNALKGFLASETSNAGSAELKNSAVFTPLAGTLGTTVLNYFGTGNSTPVTQTCQKNFVLLATDGNPTGKAADGTMYPLAQQQNTFDASSGTWTFSNAATDVFNAVTSLRTTTLTGKGALNGTYDVQTYVVGLGDSVKNASSVAILNRMAALGGGNSTAYLASNGNDLQEAFRQISADIVSKTSAASAVSLNSGSWSTGSQVFQARFSSGDWSGQLLAFALTSTGSLQQPALWDSGQVLRSQDWNTGRQIITYKPTGALGSRGVPFRWPVDATAPGTTELDPGMITALNNASDGTADGFGSQRLRYLRGDASLEPRNCAGCASPTFRDRATSDLGDIINSAPVYVSGRTGDFRDTIESVPYSSYAATRAGYAAAIFVGANDGMLHAFNAANGRELFAYVPWAVKSALSTLTDAEYSHQYTVDGTPGVGDVFYQGAWHTALVSGMNAGARGLFALDISNPSDYTEAKASKVARWEIDGSDGDVGYIFAQPVIAKTKNGRWMAIVGNGYNSTNGHAVLLVVDVETGAITRIDTLAGSTAAPNGLSGVAVVSSANNGVADIVYAGDLKGNLWKFDLSTATASSWKVAYGTTAAPAPLFKAATGQSITGRPDVTIFPNGGYLVAFGTGRYVDTGDNAAGATQALYGIWDNGAAVATADLQSQSVATTATGADGNTYRITTHAVGPATDGVLTGDNATTLANYYARKKGWVLNMPTSGERIVAQATIRFGKVVISTVIPSTAPCSAGGDGWIMEVDATTGNRADVSFDTNADNSVTATDALFVTGVSTGSKVGSGVRVGSIPAAPSILRSAKRTLDDKLINTTAGSVMKVREAGNAALAGRVSWEQLK